MDPAWPVAVVASILIAVGGLFMVFARRAAAGMRAVDRELLQALAGGVRIVLGVLLLYGADASAYAPAVKGFGFVLIGVGVVMLAVQTSTFSTWVDRWLAGSPVSRIGLGGLLAMIVGVLLWLAII